MERVDAPATPRVRTHSLGAPCRLNLASWAATPDSKAGVDPQSLRTVRLNLDRD